MSASQQTRAYLFQIYESLFSHFLFLRDICPFANLADCENSIRIKKDLFTFYWRFLLRRM